jgi:hypothetical protein
MAFAITAANFGASSGTQTAANLYRHYVLLGVRVPDTLKMAEAYRDSPWNIIANCDPESIDVVDYGALTALQISVPTLYGIDIVAKRSFLINKKK